MNDQSLHLSEGRQIEKRIEVSYIDHFNCHTILDFFNDFRILMECAQSVSPELHEPLTET